MSTLLLWLFVYNSFLSLQASGDMPPPSFCWSPLTSFGSFLEQDPRQCFSRALACMYHIWTRENMLIWPIGSSVIFQTIASSLPHRMPEPVLYLLYIPDVTQTSATVSLRLEAILHIAACSQQNSFHQCEAKGIHTSGWGWGWWQWLSTKYNSFV